MSRSINFPHDVELGRLITNLHSLETVLRDILITNTEGLEKSRKHAQSLKEMNVGQYVVENAFTNYDSLKTLIKKYNSITKVLGEKYLIDDRIVELRDAIAHGRTFSYGPNIPLILMKFSRPKEGRVKVEYNATMTIEWFDEQIKRVKRELDKAIKASELLLRGNY